MKDGGVEFLKSALETNMGLNDIVHESASFLAGLAGVIMAITLTQVFSATGLQKIGFMIISITSFIVVLFSIGVVRPKIGQNKSNLMYYKGILKLSRDKYLKDIRLTVNSDKKTVEEFCEEIYDLSIELKQKFKMIRRGADVFAVGLLIGIVLIFL
jgi:hypothetical protein